LKDYDPNKELKLKVPADVALDDDAELCVVISVYGNLEEQVNLASAISLFFFIIPLT
jgi:hypothetical protein